MKKIKFQKKLSLNKETVAKLNEEQMEQANGGTFGTGYSALARCGRENPHPSRQSAYCEAQRPVTGWCQGGYTQRFCM